MLYLKVVIENSGSKILIKINFDSEIDHEKLCVHIRNMHRYLHRVRKEIDNELAKTYRESEQSALSSH